MEHVTSTVANGRLNKQVMQDVHGWDSLVPLPRGLDMANLQRYVNTMPDGRPGIGVLDAVTHFDSRAFAVAWE